MPIVVIAQLGAGGIDVTDACQCERGYYAGTRAMNVEMFECLAASFGEYAIG